MHVDLPMIYICAHMLLCAPEVPLNKEHLPKLALPLLCHLPGTTLPLCQPQTQAWDETHNCSEASVL